MKFVKMCLSVMVALLLLTSTQTNAGTTGKIVGDVTDSETGAPLIGANIVVAGTDFGASTNQDGHYVILNLPPGQYELQASMIGYGKVTVQKVKVVSDLTTKINVEMSTESLEGEQVVVIAERPMIRKDVTTSSASVTVDELEAMPVEEFEQVLEMQAGVVQDAGGAIHIRGGRSDEVRYMVDGVPVTDPFNSSMAVEVENNSIEELQMVSGTFNAEYGQAMSGVVNIVTRSGDLENYSGKVSYYTGDYLSTHSDLFDNIDHVSPKDLSDLQGSLEGPVPFLKSIVSFYFSGRRVYDDGYLYGVRKYEPDSYVRDYTDGSWSFDHYGDSSAVAMNWSDQTSLQGKLLFRITPKIKLTVNDIYSTTKYQTYSHSFKLNPDGNLKNFRDNNSVIVNLNHSLSSKTFYTLSGSRFSNHVWYHVFEDTSKYTVDPNIFQEAKTWDFYPGGYSMGHYDRTTTTDILKFDFNTQLSQRHEIKGGLEYDQDRIDYESYSILYNEKTGYRPVVPRFVPGSGDSTYYSSPNFDAYVRKPTSFASYLQDKIEFDFIIINVGLRYEWFNSDGKVLADPEDPNYKQPIKPGNQFHDLNGNGTQDPGETDKTDAERLAYWYKDAKSKVQVSPRLGVAFPLTERGVLHFSYGHFLQIPPYSYLYANPDFEVPVGSFPTVGNANLEPQRTVQYEIGLQQQFSDNLAIYVTGFYKDIRNLLGTQIFETANVQKYALYVNRDYGNVRGVTFALQKRMSGIFGARLDYTYSVAEGNASDPASSYYDESAGRQPEKQLVFLDWDQRHTINASIQMRPGENWGFSMNARYGSGLPYTPASINGDRIAFENSDRKPARYNVDLRAYRRFKLTTGMQLTLLCNVYNLFDTKNENYVFDSTGRATYDLETQNVDEQQNFNTLSEYMKRPQYYSAPRQVKIGAELSF